jgi:hypothetical protein
MVRDLEAGETKFGHMKKLMTLVCLHGKGRFLTGLAVLGITAGCVGYAGYAGPDYGYWGPGYHEDWGGDVTVFGGVRGDARHDHDFSRRGASSRATGGFHGGGIHGGGGEHR